MSDLMQLDKAVLLWINSHHNIVLDAILAPVAYAGEAGAIWFLAALVLFILNRPGYRRTAILLVVTMIVVDRVFAHYMGEVFDRPRPYMAMDNIRQLGVHWTSGSFPSGHAHSVWVAAIIIGSRWHKLRWPLVVFALLTCYSRPYFGMHYPIDTLAGALLGVAAGGLAVFINSRILQPHKKVEPDGA
jgi:undecaprenyl-diphosphatase